MDKNSQLLTEAIAWAKKQSEIILKSGEELNGVETDIAKKAGVTHPEIVRVYEVPTLPLPENSQLRQAALAVGMFSPTMTGLTLGYGIYLVQGHRSNRLISHELRHVAQYEEAGSISGFLSEYLGQLTSVGYTQAPLEIDAREHESD